VGGDLADGGEDGVQMAGEDDAEEVVQIGGVTADGLFGEADGDCEVLEGDVGAAVGGEDFFGGFEDVGTALPVPLAEGRAGWALFGLGAEEAGGDGGHGAVV
jgi:hypothetical protein